MGAAEDDLARRVAGLERTGIVALRDFDQGVVETIAGAFGAVSDPKDAPPGYYLNIIGTCPPDGLPGIPVYFANPEDIASDYKMPCVTVRRDDIMPAMDRWHPNGIQYRAPGLGAVPFVATGPGFVQKSGWDRMSQREQAHPFDIIYTISIKARFRGAQKLPTDSTQRSNVAALLDHLLKTFPVYGLITVVDSIGDTRTYNAYNEGLANIDAIPEVQDREIGFAITLRVEAELDLTREAAFTTARSKKTQFSQFDPE